MRIVTYNTRGSLGMDGLRDTRRIADVVRGLSPDIVCFQEIHQRLAWSGREDQPAALRRLLARELVFQKNLTVGFGGYGVAIALRTTPDVVRNHFLPGGREQRGALEIQYRRSAGSVPISVFCTHWGLTSEERLCQAEALAEIVLRAPGATVVCGDLNEDLDSAAVQSFLSRTGLRDAGAGTAGATYPSDVPRSRIDFIFYSGDRLALERTEVIQALASDHLPVLADLQPIVKR